MFRLPNESDCTTDANQLFPHCLKSVPLFLNLAASLHVFQLHLIIPMLWNWKLTQQFWRA